MKNIHVIPTNKLSRLYIDNKGKYNLEIGQVDFKTFQNIYITSDEKFVRDEYITDGIEVIKATPKLVNAQGLVNRRNWRKVILTTDQDLIKDGVQAIDDEFLEWFVKNPSCEEVDVERMFNVVQFTSREFIYKIIIPKEELKTSEEWQKQFPNTKVTDPDGWDRKNYQYSWFEEKITLAEYTTRLSRSTVYGIIPKEEQKQHLIGIMEKDEELGLYEYIGECKGNDGNGCFMDSSGHDCGCYTRSIKQETEHLLSTKANKEIKLEDIFNDEKRQGVKELIDKHNQHFYCSDRLELDENERCVTQCDHCADIKPKQRLEKYSERFDNDKSEIGNPDTWGKRVIDKHKQDDENYLDSFGVTKTQFEVYRNFNKQETLGLKVSEETVYYQVLIVNNKGEKLAFKQNDKWTINASTEEILDQIFKTI